MTLPSTGYVYYFMVSYFCLYACAHTLRQFEGHHTVGRHLQAGVALSWNVEIRHIAVMAFAVVLLAGEHFS
jgi:hypothetical protein